MVLGHSAAQLLGTTHSAARSDTPMKKHNAIARGLTDRQHDYLRLTTNWRIPADNNGSERDIHMIKTPPKSLRLPTHPHRSPTILRNPQLSIHRRPFFDTLVMPAEGRPWLPATQ
jgi:transposase